MSFFCNLDKDTLKALKESKQKFEKGIQNLNSEEKDHLLRYMYQTRHNLLVDLTEEKNKNLCLIVISCICIITKIIGLF